MGVFGVPPLRSRLRPDQRGAAAVEFALVLPILLAVVFGIITYGLIFASQISLNSAARDAARAGVVQPLNGTGLTCAQIATMGRDNSHPLGAAKTQVQVTVTSPDGSSPCILAVGSTTVSGPDPSALPCSGSAGSSDPLVVELTYEAKSPVPLVPGTDTTLSARGEFQCEYS